MKRYLWSLLVIGLLLTQASLAFASDVTGASWIGNVVVTDNGTSAASSVSTNFTLSSADLIANNEANSTLADVSMKYNGSDVPFMPGNGSNPWILFVNTIGAGQNENFKLYTDHVTGGKIRYFPGPTGMSTPNDSVNMSYGGNFTQEVKGFFDTSASAVGANITSKYDSTLGGFREYVSSLGNVTASIYNPVAPTIVNANMETAASGWVGGAQSNARAHAGTWSWLPPLNSSSNQTLAWNSYYAGQTFTFTCWAWTANANSGEIGIYDGVGAISYSSFVNNDSAWHQLTVTKTLSTSATQLTLELTDAAGLVYFDDAADTTLLVPTSVTAPVSSAEHTLVDSLYKNEVTNGTAEDGTASWATSRAAVSSNTTVVAQGTYSLAVQANDGAGIGASQLYQDIPFVAAWKGQNAVLAVYYNTPAINPRTQMARVWDGVTMHTTGALIKDGAYHWAQLPFTFAATATGAQVNIAEKTEAVVDTTSYMYVDAIILVIGVTSIPDFNTLRMYIDGVDSAHTYTEVTVPNNTNPWVDCEAAAMPYAGSSSGYSVRRYVGGVLEQEIPNWEYHIYNNDATFTNGTGTATGSPVTLALGVNNIAVTVNGTFAVVVPYGFSAVTQSDTGTVTGSPVYCAGGTSPDILLGTVITVPGGGTGNIKVTLSEAFHDASGHGHDATPSFRTTTSDPDVSAVLNDFSPVAQSTLTTAVTTSGPAQVLTGIPTAPAQLYTEEDYSKIPGAEAANELLDAGAVPRVMWWFPFIFYGIAFAGMLSYAATRLHNSPGTLWMPIIVIEMGFILLGLTNVIAFFPAVIFLIPAITILTADKHYSLG